MSASTLTHTHTRTGARPFLHRADISLHSQTKWGNRSKLFAYKLMKYYWVKLSWMLITNVMHYLLINGSSLFWARDGTSKWMIIRYMQMQGWDQAPLRQGRARTPEQRRGSTVGRQTVVLSSVDTVTRHKVLFYWSGWNENALFIVRSLIMNPPKAGWEAEVWSVQVKALLLRIHITYFISQFDLREQAPCNSKEWRQSEQHNNYKDTLTS